jgi:hypothetical protein
MPDSCSTPVLIVAHRRPDLTSNLISALRLVEPPEVFFAVDGPRSHVSGELDLVSQVRALEVRLDWGCSVKKLFSSQNLGCGIAVPTAISWFFDHVEEGIILEDDLLPSRSFFPYAEALLTRYRHNPAVWAISGSNPHGLEFSAPGDYGFVGLSSVWGWATWANRWKTHDWKLEDWKIQRSMPGRIPPAMSQAHFFAFGQNLDRLSKSARPHTWDFQVTWSTIRDGGLWAIPQKNLVKNCGYDNRATHTTGAQPRFSREAHEFSSLEHPVQVLRDGRAERRLLWRAYRVTGIVVIDSFLSFLRKLRHRASALRGSS